MTLWSPRERAAWRRAPRLSMPEYAEQQRYITVGPSKGKYSTKTFPLGIEIMNIIADPAFDETIVVGPRQTAKTVDAVENPILYFIAHGMSVLVVYPTGPQARRVWEDRLKPALAASPGLRHLLPPPHIQGTPQEGIRFAHGPRLYMVGAGALADLTQFSVEVVIMDEIDYFFERTGAMNPVTLERTRRAIEMAVGRSDAFPVTRRIAKICTVTTPEGPIWKEYMESDQRKPWVPCPRCGRYQILRFDGMVIEEEHRGGVRPQDPQSEAEARGSYYECAWCEGHISHADKPFMLSRHLWVPESWAVDEHGQKHPPEDWEPKSKAGFWYNRWYSPWWDFGRVALKRFRQREDLEDFQKHDEVVPWIPPHVEVNTIGDDQVRAHIGLKHRQLPAHADLLVLGADVHRRVIYWMLMGFETAGRTAWLIDNGTINTLAPFDLPRSITENEVRAIRGGLNDLWQVYQEGILEPGGKVRQAHICPIDAGYAPDTVYGFCMEAGLDLFIPIVGLGSAGPAKFIPQKWKEAPKPWEIRAEHAYSVVTAEGVRRLNVDSNWGKLQVHQALRTPLGAAGCLYLHENITISVVKQLTAERWVQDEEKGAGEWQRVRPNNHYLDVASYCYIMADTLGAKVLAKEVQAKAVHSEPERQDRSAAHPQRGGSSIRTRY